MVDGSLLQQGAVAISRADPDGNGSVVKDTLECTDDDAQANRQGGNDRRVINRFRSVTDTAQPATSFWWRKKRGIKHSLSVVTDAHGNKPLPQGLADDLRQAFADHGGRPGKPWCVHVEDIVRPSKKATAAGHVVRINLTRTDTAMLTALLQAIIAAEGEEPLAPVGRRIGTREVAQLINRAQGTIRSWISQGGPANNPFPAPEKHLGRCEWNQAEVEAWLDQEEAVRPSHLQRVKTKRIRPPRKKPGDAPA